MLLSHAYVTFALRRPIGAAILSMSLALGMAGIARADDPSADVASPAPSASSAALAQTQPPGPAPGGPGGGAQTGQVRTPSRFSNLPVIDIVPIFTTPFPAFSSSTFQNPLVNSGTGYDPLDIGGTFKLPITRYLSASFDRIVEGTLNVPNAEVTKIDKGVVVPNVPSFTRDVVLVYRLDQNIKHFQIEEGLYFRHRAVGGSGTSALPFPPTTSSTEAHYGYVGITYTTPKFAALNGAYFTFNINGDTQAVDHHVGCGTDTTFSSGDNSVPCINGVADVNPGRSRYFETDQYAQITVPLNKTTTFTAQDKWGAANFYENAFFPYRLATSQSYVFTRRFDRFFSISLRDKTQTYVAQGAPYIFPNAVHNGAFDVLADIKIDTSHL